MTRPPCATAVEVLAIQSPTYLCCASPERSMVRARKRRQVLVGAREWPAAGVRASCDTQVASPQEGGASALRVRTDCRHESLRNGDMEVVTGRSRRFVHFEDPRRTVNFLDCPMIVHISAQCQDLHPQPWVFSLIRVISRCAVVFYSCWVWRTALRVSARCCRVRFLREWRRSRRPGLHGGEVNALSIVP